MLKDFCGIRINNNLRSPINNQTDELFVSFYNPGESEKEQR